MINVRTRLLIILGILVCLFGLSGAPTFAIDVSVIVNATLDHVTITPVNPEVITTTTTFQFTATASYTNAPPAIVTDSSNWSSSNTSVATIGLHTGLATILTEGNTTISVEYNGKTDNTTCVIVAGTTPPPGGGGGGGGGGVGGVPTSTTSLSGNINSEGLILIDTAAVSYDGLANLLLPEGTTARNKYGQTLSSITMKENTAPSNPPTDCQFVCLAYDIGPNGATFDPPASLIYYYDDARVPAGVAEENLVFATLQDGQWIDLENTVVDTVNNIVTAPTTHLSLFTVMAYTSPARFEVSNFTVTPAEIYLNDAVSISTTITNTGDLTGSYEAILKIDNEVIRNQNQTLKGGSSETIVFSFMADTAGEHRASIGSNVATFIVKKPPSPAVFEVSELNIDPLSINPGEKVNITVFIQNTGDLAGTYPLSFYVDDEKVESREVALDGGGSMTLRFSFFADASGEHTVNVGDLQGAFDVKLSVIPEIPELPNLEIKSFSTTPDYDETTNTLISVKIEYQMNQTWTSATDAKLMMTVLHNGELLEQIPLFTPGQMMNDGKTGGLSYVPPTGWMAGEYAFSVELFNSDNILQDTLSHSLIVTSARVTKVVSLWTLGGVIGIVAVLIIVLLTIVVYRRQDMLTNPVKIIRNIKYIKKDE